MGSPAPSLERIEDKDARKQRKREEKLLAAGRRPPDAWQRYRILADVVDSGRRLIDLADHKARFALVIMGFVNALIAFVGTRRPVVDAIPDGLWPWSAAVLIPYIVVVLGFLAYAVECLRPRGIQGGAPGGVPAAGAAKGVLFWEHILKQDPASLRRAWDEIQMDQVDAELVLLTYGQARINEAKYAALRRLYICLHVMIAMAALLLTVAGFCVLFETLGLLR